MASGESGGSFGGIGSIPRAAIPPPMALTDLAIRNLKPADKPFKPSDSGGLLQPLGAHVEVLHLEGDERAVTGAGEDEEGDQRPVALLDVGPGRHPLQHGPYLLKAWHRTFPPRGIARLHGEPCEEPLQGGQDRGDGGGARLLASAGIHRLG